MFRFPLLLKGEFQSTGFFRAQCSSTSSKSELVEARGAITLHVKELLISGHRILGALSILCCMLYEVRKYTSIRAFPNQHKSFTPDFSSENMVSLKELWPWNELENFVVFSTNRVKDAVNYFILLHNFWKSFTFLVPLLLE